MAIDAGKILRTSDKDYFNLTGENRSDYILEKVGAHTIKPNSVEDKFANTVPNEAEVVVNYITPSTNNCNFAFGTALIPKKYKSNSHVL